MLVSSPDDLYESKRGYLAASVPRGTECPSRVRGEFRLHSLKAQVPDDSW